MRVILLLVAVVLLMFFAGWVTFTRSDSTTSINIEREQIEQDSDRMLQRGREILNDTQPSAADR